MLGPEPGRSPGNLLGARVVKESVRSRAMSFVPIVILVMATGASAAISLTTTPAGTTLRAWHDPDLPRANAAPDRNGRAAVTEAQRLMSLVHPPSSWATDPSPPTQPLNSPMSSAATADLVDLYQLWTAHGTMQSVQAWVSAHPPSGSAPAGSGSSSQFGELLETSLTFGYRAVGRQFESRQLLVTIAARPRGAVGIRVDAQVIWYPSRPAIETVPSGVTRVRATVFVRAPLPGSPEDVLGARTFTDRAVVRLVSHRVDALSPEVPGPRSCPDDTGTGPQLDLDFSGTPGVPPVKVHVDTNGCGGVSFSVGGIAQAPLTDNGLFRRVDQLLGLDLPAVDERSP